jgi:hypothetical protein
LKLLFKYKIKFTNNLMFNKKVLIFMSFKRIQKLDFESLYLFEINKQMCNCFEMFKRN